MPVPQNAQTIYSYLVGIGLTPTAASGVLGNIEQESGGDPAAYNPSGGGQCGIIQWYPCSVPVGNLQAQLPALGQYIANNGGVTALNNASTSPAAAAQAFMGMERCEGWNTDPYGVCNLGNRAASAAAVLQAAQTGNWTAGASGQLLSAQGGEGQATSTCLWGINLPSIGSTIGLGGGTQYCILQKSQGKALLGGLAMLGGGLVFATGIYMIFRASETGRTAQRSMAVALEDGSPLGYVANQTVRRRSRRRSGGRQGPRTASTSQEREEAAQRRAEEREQYAQNREAERRYRTASRGVSREAEREQFRREGFPSDTIDRGLSTPVSGTATTRRAGRPRERRPRTRT